MTPEERETRLLDAAEELFLRLGHAKTTVGDITSAAGVSKGAFYLVWSSKDELIEALIVREMARFSEAWMARAEDHPRGGTLGAMYEAMLWALDGHPLMARIVGGDSELLMQVLRRPGNALVALGEGQPSRADVVARLQDVGAVRDDVEPGVIAYIMDVLAHGLTAEPGAIQSSSGRPDTAALIHGVAAMMDRAFTPDDADTEAGKRVIREVFEAAHRRYEAHLKGRGDDVAGREPS